MKFKNKYRSETTRLKGWDYGSNASYFVTICTKNRAHYFGNIVDGEMILSDIGEIAQSCWYKIPEHYPFVVLGAFVVMPNHVHGIIIINKNDDNIVNPVETQNFASPQSQSVPKSQTVETQNFAPQHSQTDPQPPRETKISRNKFGPQSKNLAAIVRGYKVGVKKYATINEIDFLWQSSYHDHIIRNDKSFERISRYIEDNPIKCEEDTFYL